MRDCTCHQPWSSHGNFEHAVGCPAGEPHADTVARVDAAADLRTWLDTANVPAGPWTELVLRAVEALESPDCPGVDCFGVDVVASIPHDVGSA